MIIRKLIKNASEKIANLKTKLADANEKNRKSKTPKIKLSLIAAYVCVFALVVAMVSLGYSKPQETSNLANADQTTVSQVEQISVDSVIASNVAASVARISNLPVSNAVANLAITNSVKMQLAQSDNTTLLSKPQIIELNSGNRLIKTYAVVEGDTVDSIAAKFGITTQTIKWNNNMSNDRLTVGQSLQILPINGVAYTVKENDTIDTIADRYKSDKTRLVVYNDLDIGGLKTGSKIILPEATLPENERPGYVAPITLNRNNIAYGYSGGNMRIISSPYWNGYYTVNDAVKAMIPQISSLGSSTPGNMMALGNCTWWAWERRYALGRPLPSDSIGNAGVWWWVLSSRYGYVVDKNIEEGAVFESYGHVGIIEKINYDEMGKIVSFTTSEMNVPYINFQVVERTLPASSIGEYNYIH